MLAIQLIPKIIPVVSLQIVAGIVTAERQTIAEPSGIESASNGNRISVESLANAGGGFDCSSSDAVQEPLGKTFTWTGLKTGKKPK